MSIDLPARGSFPALDPAGNVGPSLPVLDADISAVVQEQNWVAAYVARMHASQAWPSSGLGSCFGQGLATVGSKTNVILEYLLKPRVHRLGLQVRFRTIKSDAAATGTLRLTCEESGASVDIAITAGAEQYDTGVLDLRREDQLSLIEVSLYASAGTIALVSLAIWDEDLAAADLHMDLYADVAAGTADSLVRYWALQEDDDAGTNATADDAMGSGDNLAAYNGVTQDSSIINVDRIYRRVFGSSDYMAGTYTAAANADWSAMIEIQDLNTTTTSRHTYISLGEGGASGGVSFGHYSGTIGYLLQVGTKIAYSSTYGSMVVPTIPHTEVHTFFIVHDFSAATVTLYEADGEGSVTIALQVAYSPTAAGLALRLANGIGSAGYFDTGNYLNDGEIRSCAIWERELSLAEMNQAAKITRIRGAQIVR